MVSMQGGGAMGLDQLDQGGVQECTHHQQIHSESVKATRREIKKEDSRRRLVMFVALDARAGVYGVCRGCFVDCS